MLIERITITRPDGTIIELRSGDNETFMSLSSQEREWIHYLVNSDITCKDRTLNVNGTHYKPHYKRTKRK